ncbi:MAG: sigma-70 family RNA polymerase sigma factor [Verrucomicrobiales bacterium]|nr:sigma-70 family RNA polymerase sigma factor [Verrucomicrobiales bacterium]
MDSADRESQIVALLTDIQLPLRHYVQSLMPGDSHAHDVAQQTNATLWQKRDDFELGTHFKAWAFSIARFEVLNYRKQQARDARLGLTFSDELESVMTRELAEEPDDFDERQAALEQCLNKLRPADKQLILHRYFQDGTLQAFAEQHGRSVGGLRVTLHRLRATLQTCIERALTPNEPAS